MTCLISPEVKVHKLPILQDHVLKMPFERPLLDIHAYTFECMAFPLIKASKKISSLTVRIGVFVDRRNEHRNPPTNIHTHKKISFLKIW